MKILYAGSPDASRITLEKLFERQSDCGFEISGVLTNPPSAQGRHKTLIPTSTASFAMEKGIPVFTPEHLDSQARALIEPLHCDLLVSFAYGHIFGPKFLSLFPSGGFFYFQKKYQQSGNKKTFQGKKPGQKRRKFSIKISWQSNIY